MTSRCFSVEHCFSNVWIWTYATYMSECTLELRASYIHHYYTTLQFKVYSYSAPKLKWQMHWATKDWSISLEMTTQQDLGQWHKVPTLYRFHSLWALFEWKFISSVQSVAPPAFLTIIADPPGWFLMYGVASYISLPTRIQADSRLACLRNWHTEYHGSCSLAVQILDKAPMSQFDSWETICNGRLFFLMQDRHEGLPQVSLQHGHASHSEFSAGLHGLQLTLNSSSWLFSCRSIWTEYFERMMLLYSLLLRICFCNNYQCAVDTIKEQI